jgi:uncharacterized membrane protein YphA (DoxX/SURF4 family)
VVQYAGLIHKFDRRSIMDGIIKLLFKWETSNKKIADIVYMVSKVLYGIIFLLGIVTLFTAKVPTPVWEVVALLIGRSIFNKTEGVPKRTFFEYWCLLTIIFGIITIIFGDAITSLVDGNSFLIELILFAISMGRVYIVKKIKSSTIQ